MVEHSTRPVCGFIGLGSQGAPIARRIIGAGYPVVLWARREQTLRPFRGTPAAIASSIAEVGARSDHVGTCVTDDAAVREVCGSLIPAMRLGARIAVHSTTHPDTCRDSASEAVCHNLVFIEAPVSGGAPAAAAGTLTIMMGGDTQAIAAARPIFETFGKLLVHLGEVGSAQRAKLLNNTMMAANLGLVHSAVSAGVGLGIDRRALLEILGTSSGRSYVLEVCASVRPERIQPWCDSARESPSAWTGAGKRAPCARGASSCRRGTSSSIAGKYGVLSRLCFERSSGMHRLLRPFCVCFARTCRSPWRILTR